MIPVNLVPPSFEELPLSFDTIIVQPHVLPSVHTHQRHHIYTAQWLLWSLVLLGRVSKGANRVQRLVRIGVVGVEVLRLPPVVGSGQRRAGEVGGEDSEVAELGVVGLYQPDEAWAEHGIGGVQESLLQGIEGREVASYLSCEVGRGLGCHVGITADTTEEEVVVEGHAGNVEEICPGGVAGELDDERLGVLILVMGT